ncbi:type VI secretion system contractile sheath small subunit [Pelotalea chapellei]|uniref:Type VI secretion system contractile sheath small subunit n=1 Tax=Pelotalea chapellei TaxID=44671 RepID=A0ABS5UAR8_9BACT|nr:type VI secretion system contractile sheath small subunit [Pelotalea chapellei]MBT1072783.1 type VI secretion system contractile sheath small subunit [Pelotalea chapellei]
MSKEASVAPKERVNIVYRPADGDGKEDVELPLKMLVMGDFTGRPDDRPIEKRDPVAIDKDNFNDVMKAQGITLNLSVPNRLVSREGEELPVSLKVESLKDFGPEAVAEQVEEMKTLLQLREALRALKGPLSNVPEFRRKIQELITDDATRTKLLAEIGLAEG